MAKRVLLTGVGGFVGHHCLEYFLEKTDWEIICLDSFRHKGTVRRCVEVFDDNKRVKFYKHDLSVPIDPQLENLIFERRIDDRGNVLEKPIHYIINLASESAVERSAVDPVSCLRNNYELQINMLEFARKTKGVEMFLQISTDEVYGEAPPNESHKEWSTIMPSNPYAASKAAQEALCIAYWRTYDMPIVMVNIMNMIGERQDPEKFLPKIIQKVARGEEMPIYADGYRIGSRIYLHAKNMADALVFITQTKRCQPRLYSHFVARGDTWAARPDRYNICGDVEINNLELAKLVAASMNKELKYKLVPSESARPGYDRRYALDGAKLKSIGWTAPLTFEQSIKSIVDWTLQNPHWVV